MKKVLYQKVLGLCVGLILVFLIFAALTPSVSAVKVFAGNPNNNEVYVGETIVFNDVELTIRAAEAVPVDQLIFIIYNSSTNHKIGQLHFSIFGVEISENPKGAFTVVNVTDLSDLPYQSSGSFYGYDELTGYNITDFENGYGYGYGYGNTDITIIYKITFKTCIPGTYYAKLFVKTDDYKYASGKSSYFTVLPKPLLSVYVDIKPGSWPNYINTKNHGYITIAICGTQSFDVKTINPKSLKLCLEGGKNFVKTPHWKYEDVATPWKGADGSGHSQKNDGYTDLVLKYRVEQFVHVLKLFKKSNGNIKIIICGCLKNTECYSPLMGHDYITLQNTVKNKNK